MVSVVGGGGTYSAIAKRLPIGWPVLTAQFNIKTTFQFNRAPLFAYNSAS